LERVFVYGRRREVAVNRRMRWWGRMVVYEVGMRRGRMGDFEVEEEEEWRKAIFGSFSGGGDGEVGVEEFAGEPQ